MKKVVALTLTMLMVLNFCIICMFPVSAHEAVLNIQYDTCEEEIDGEGINEMWYVLERNEVCRHTSQDVDTIRYRFDDNPDWIPLIGREYVEEFAQDIKDWVADSIEKWNNVYFYSYDSSGIVTKRKVINVVEMTGEDYDLLIVPDTDMMSVGQTYPEDDQTSSGHYHYSNWVMRINVDYFFEGTYLSLSAEDVNYSREAVGAHELGHVLGLRDVDYVSRDGENICGSNTNEPHHEDVLMGYAQQFGDASPSITYKDIAGVAITRGFHTDDDHQWLYMPRQDATDYKLVCWICNGVKYVDNLADYPYMPYDCCEGDHDLSDGNMRAVASYGNQDYYKCRYCRYVAPFSDIETQNYIKTYQSDTLHKCVNNVDGLEYTFYEEHTLTDNGCLGCGFLHTHTYNDCESIDGTSHQRTCECGASIVESHTKVHISCNNNDYHLVRCACGYQSNSPHVVAPTSVNRGPCLLCGQMVTIGNNTMQPWGQDDEESLY